MFTCVGPEKHDASGEKRLPTSQRHNHPGLRIHAASQINDERMALKLPESEHEAMTGESS